MPGPLSSPIVRDGDTSFIGLQSRRNPITIPAGYLQAASNIRLDRGIATTRAGAKRLTQGISASGTIVTVPFTVTSATISSISQSSNTATATTSTAHKLLAGWQVKILGVGIANYNGTFTILTVPTPTTFTYAVSGSPSASSGGSVGYPVLQSSSTTAGIYAAGVYSSPRFDNSNEYVVLAGSTQAYLWRSTSSGPTVITKSYPVSPITESIQNSDAVSVVQAFDQVFIFRWRNEATKTISTLTQSSGTATATTAAAHGYATGEVVRISGSDQAGFNLDAVITVTGTTTFTFAVPSATAANGSSGVTTYLLAQRVCCPLVWDGQTSTNFVRVPTGTSPLGATYSYLSSPYGAIATFYNNQLVIANARDALIVSDVLDPTNFDPLLKSFRTNVGSNDYITAIHPYANGQVIVFLRKSIYLGKIVLKSDGVSIDPAASFLQILTNEIGCNARNTVTTAGNYIYFLSDNGVYRLDNTQLDLALRGNTLPLSEPIADILSTINPATVSNACGLYFNNRYYLAIPTGSSTSNNTLLIYNQLNEAWESVDTYPFSLDRLVVSDYVTTTATQRRLYAASTTGLLYLLEQYNSAADDATSGDASVGVVGSLTTRRYFYGQLNHKRLNSVTVSSYLPAGSTVNVTAIATDRDSTTQVASVTNAEADNDYTIKAPIRRTAEYLDIQVSTSGGRPTIRAISADAAVTSDPSRLARTES